MYLLPSLRILHRKGANGESETRANNHGHCGGWDDPVTQRRGSSGGNPNQDNTDGAAKSYHARAYGKRDASLLRRIAIPNVQL